MESQFQSKSTSSARSTTDTKVNVKSTSTSPYQHDPDPVDLVRDRRLDADDDAALGSWQESLNRQRETDGRQIESRLMDDFHPQHHHNKSGGHQHGLGAAAEAGSIDVARFSHFSHSALTRTRIGYHSAPWSVSSPVPTTAGTLSSNHTSSSTNQSSSNHSRFFATNIPIFSFFSQPKIGKWEKERKPCYLPIHLFFFFFFLFSSFFIVFFFLTGFRHFFFSR